MLKIKFWSVCYFLNKKIVGFYSKFCNLTFVISILLSILLTTIVLFAIKLTNIDYSMLKFLASGQGQTNDKILKMCNNYQHDRSIAFMRTRIILSAMSTHHPVRVIQINKIIQKISSPFLHGPSRYVRKGTCGLLQPLCGLLEPLCGILQPL